MGQAVQDPRLIDARVAPRRRMRLSWSDPRLRNLVWQILIIGAVVLAGWYLAHNTNRNLEQRHIATGFGFLGQAASIPIGESLLSYTPSVSTYGRALLIGVLNTLKVAVAGVVLATVLGTLVGIARLSPNWLLSRIAAIYVETVRDIPVLLQLFFWYGLLQTLPPPRAAFHPLPGVFLSNRGVKLPTIAWHAAHFWALVAFLAGCVLVWLIGRAADRRQAATGRRPRTWPTTLAALLGLPILVWLGLGAPLHVDMPALHGFNFQGGISITPEYAALLTGLVVYTATYIAEIVRSGIQAVAAGQWEAAGALGLPRGLVLRRIVLPQALRVIVPPMTSQYLNLVKNSSLAIAIGYQDIVSIADTTLNQTGQSIEGIAIIMAVYLTFSLSISLFMNWYNAHIALVER
ncbi:MAG: amino acid ABC transporter permease [Rhodospirillales bacterium]|nr:amino acid ABC transporter permease [Rhodospirillales bacterium]